MPAPLEHILNEVWVFLFVCLFAFLNYVKAYRMVQGSIIPLINEQKAWKSYPSLLNSQAEPQRCTFFFFFFIFSQFQCLAGPIKFAFIEHLTCLFEGKCPLLVISSLSVLIKASTSGLHQCFLLYHFLPVK